MGVVKMGKRRKENMEIYEGHGITIFGNYSWRKDMREQFKRDCNRYGVEVARLKRELVFLEDSNLASRDWEEYQYEHEMLKEKIEEAKKRKR